MPSHLVLQFLGLPQVLLDQEPIAIDRRKAIALLAYLAVNDIGHSRQKYSRESLSALLWPDYDQAKAFSSLRKIIWEVHQAIGAGWLIADRGSVALNTEPEIELDVARFQDLLSQSHQHNEPAARVPIFVESIKLYRDHFLTGFSLKDARNFDEWAFSVSEDLRHQLLYALTMLSEDYCALGQAGQAIGYARRLVTFDPLNEASHRLLMQAYVQAGQHNAALKQYQICEQMLRKELGIDPQPETYALYKQIRKGEIKPVQIKRPVRTIAPRHNLPSQLSTFIGREREQDEITNLIAKNQLVTLVGPGGIGKTRLSLEAAHGLLDSFRHGVWFIELASLSDPALVPQTIASTLGLIEQAGSPLIILTEFLHGKHALLILDNCEHLIHACAQLAEILLHGCPHLHILATSREPLGIAEEILYLVPTLASPDPGHATLDTLSQYEAVQLFVERAQSAMTGFMITRENAPSIAQICFHLDGIPLAIELAAARVKLLRVKEIASRLNDRFRLLTDGAGTASPRQQTLRALIDWSHDLLNDTERILLRRLSVFTGGWSLEAAESVCRSEGIEIHEILDLLTQLHNKSLIIVKRKQGQQTRYWMLDMTRQYAYEKLSVAGEEEMLQERHLLYFVDLAETAELKLSGSEQGAWLDLLESDHQNLRTALTRALGQKDAERALRLSAALWQFWILRGYIEEGHVWLNRALEISEMEPSLALQRARATALYRAGFLAFHQGKHKQSKEWCQESFSQFQKLGDARGMNWAQYVLALIVLFQGDPERAAVLLEGSLAVFRELEDARGVSWALTDLGLVALQQGDHSRSAMLLEESQMLFRTLGDIRNVANSFLNLGSLAYELGNYSEAEERFLSALELFQQAGDKGYTIVLCLINLGEVAWARGDNARAKEFLKEGIKLVFNTGVKPLTALGLAVLAWVAVGEGQHERAVQLLGAAATQHDIMTAQVTPTERAAYERHLAAIKSELEPAVFTKMWAAGQAMPSEDIIAFALNETVSTIMPPSKR